jgi:molybdopterin synthase sulfur carrier subunit
MRAKGKELLFTYVKPSRGAFVMSIESEEEIDKLRESEEQKILFSPEKESEVNLVIVRVKAFASFREVLGGEIEMELRDGSTIKDLLEALNAENKDFSKVAFEASGILKDYVFLMRNRARIDHRDDLNIVLHEGDELAIFPPVAGG